MKVLILGSKGSTGRRYATILRMINAEVIEYDILNHRNNQKYPRGDAAIIATPTQLHAHQAQILLEMNYKKILIEKPVSKDIEDISYLKDISDGREVTMVCNWKFSMFKDLSPNSHQVSYNYFNHGRDDSPWWDLCQLAYLQEGVNFDFAYDSPFFQASIDGFNITLNDIEISYYRMITAWIAIPNSLWDLGDAFDMTNKINQYLDP